MIPLNVTRVAWLALAATCSLASPAIAREAVTPEQVQKAVIVVDDPLEREVVLNTRNAVRQRRTLFRITENDSYLMASIHKGSGAVRFEVRQAIQYGGPFRQYESVNYETSGLPQSVALRVLETNKEHCFSVEVSVLCVEEVSFPVSEAELRGAATSSGGYAADAWEMKFNARNGKPLRAQIPQAEIAGLLRAVDAHRSTHGFKTAGAPVAAY